MDDFDPVEFFALTGIDVRLAKPVIEPPLSSAGAAAQAELLSRLAAMRATLEMMEVMVRDKPNDDRAFDIFDETLAKQMSEAPGALQRLRERRDCEGAA